MIVHAQQGLQEKKFETDLVLFHSRHLDLKERKAHVLLITLTIAICSSVPISHANVSSEPVCIIPVFFSQHALHDPAMQTVTTTPNLPLVTLQLK